MERITIEMLQNASPERRAELDRELSRLLLRRFAGFVALKLFILIGIRLAVKKFWGPDQKNA